MSGGVKPVVAVIAAGAMGSGVGRRLTENGVTVLTSLEGRGEASVKRAKAAGMRPASDAEIAAADIILSIVPPSQAEALAQKLLPALKGAARKPLYADCNAVNPESVLRIAAIVAPSGCAFADAGIIGGPPRAGYNGPRFYVSGNAASQLALLGQYGLDIRVMGGEPGEASALKMCYGGLNKGLIGLASALTLAADRAGVGEAFRSELEISQREVLAQLTRGVPEMFPKAYRWVAEMDEISEFLGRRGEAEIFSGMARLYERLAADSGVDEIEALSAFFGRKNPAKSA